METENDIMSFVIKVIHIKTVCDYNKCPQRVNCYSTGKECIAVINLNRMDYDKQMQGE